MTKHLTEHSEDFVRISEQQEIEQTVNALRTRWVCIIKCRDTTIWKTPRGFYKETKRKDGTIKRFQSLWP